MKNVIKLYIRILSFCLVVLGLWMLKTIFLNDQFAFYNPFISIRMVENKVVSLVYLFSMCFNIFLASVFIVGATLMFVFKNFGRIMVFYALILKSTVLLITPIVLNALVKNTGVYEFNLYNSLYLLLALILLVRPVKMLFREV